jgi:CCR4-NOT transcriptional regulation complex NOT5 subunit
MNRRDMYQQDITARQIPVDHIMRTQSGSVIYPQQQAMQAQPQMPNSSEPTEEFPFSLDTTAPHSIESVFLQPPNPESDKEFELANLGIDLLSTAPLLPSVYYVGSDAPMAVQGQYPSSIYFPRQSQSIPASSRIDHFNEFMLLFIFYVHTGDKLQVEASNELKKRKFRYDTERKVWINQRGKVFDPNTWSYVDFSSAPRFA